MPGRVESILTNYIYHVFNKTLGGFKIFDDERYGQRFLETLRYYRSKKARISLSALKKDLPLSRQQEVWNKVNIKKYFKIEAESNLHEIHKTPNLINKKVFS